MADAKLSALTELAAAPANGDEIYIRDISEAAVDESKRITIANLFAGANVDQSVPDGQGLVVGNTSQLVFGEVTGEFQILGTTTTDAFAGIAAFSETDTVRPMLKLMKSGNATFGSFTTVADNEALGGLAAYGDDGTDYNTLVADILFNVDDSSVATGQIGGEILLRTATSGGVITTAMTIGNDQSVTLTGNLDLGSSGTILNVGAAGNDWTQNDLTLSGGPADQTITAQTTDTTARAHLDLKSPESSTLAYGLFVDFREGDGSGSANNMAYALGYNASGAFFFFRSRDTDGSATDADIWRVPDGQTTIDANTTWDINIFDKYDDALVLSPYRQGVLNLAQRQEELIELGVLRRYPDGWIGHNDQRMEALLAGGIYQNRARMDHYFAQNDSWSVSAKERLAALEEANCILAEENQRLWEVIEK